MLGKTLISNPLKTLSPFPAILVLLIAFAPIASARTCRIVFLGRPAGAPERLQLFDGSSYQEVGLPCQNLSPVYKMSSGVINLRMVTEVPANGEPPPEGAPSAPVAEGFEDCYLFLTSDPENPIAPVSIRVLDASLARIGRGEMLWINLTDKTITGTAGNSELLLLPDACEVAKEPRQGQGDYPVALNFLIGEEAARHPLCQTTWRHDPRSRSLVCILPDGTRKVPRVSSFLDFRQE